MFLLTSKANPIKNGVKSHKIILNLTIDICILSAYNACHEIEYCFSYVKQKCCNKSQHTRNGNRNKNKNIKKYKKILQINKGSSNFPTHRELLKLVINDEKPDIRIIGEANIKRDADTLATDYPNYVFQSKFMRGQDNARLATMIKKMLHIKE